jgi:hypothetical protein
MLAGRWTISCEERANVQEYMSVGAGEASKGASKEKGKFVLGEESRRHKFGLELNFHAFRSGAHLGIVAASILHNLVDDNIVVIGIVMK